MSIEVNVYVLGFVGLTLAVTLAQDSGLFVTGIDPDREKFGLLADGKVPFYEKGLQETYTKVQHQLNLSTFPCPAQYHIICVGTPASGILTQLDKCVEDIVNVCRPGDTIIIRSTVPVGTTSRYAQKYPANIKWAYAPERTLAGKALEELKELPQLVGGDPSADLLFRRMTSVIRVSSMETAETIKLVSNCWRAYTFAFANQLALDCRKTGVDIYEVLQKGSDGYSRFNLPRPGFSQGPCLTKDPSIYASIFMGRHIFERAASVNNYSFSFYLWQAAGVKKLYGNVGLIGAAFKADPPTSDLRDSPLSNIRDIFDIDPEFHDPMVKGSSPYDRVWQDKDLVIIGTEYAKLHGLKPRWDLMRPDGVVVDFWNTWPEIQHPNYKVFGRP